MPTSTRDEDESSWNAYNRHIYPQRLKEYEFRVMCFYPVEDVSAPIHVTLEVYDDLRYHEYETLSYTWGGENEDSRLTHPVYIGPYWDILIQTHNCWEMLRHMRPWKGVRTIWVDAICINQADMQERQEQVAKMGRIYEKASRLVIYLGPDLVPPTSTSSPYPKRHHLQELDSLAERPQLPSAALSSSTQWTLSDVLRRQYFRRLWIIQELIMSRNITLRVGNIEFIVDQAVSSQAVQACDMPWFTFITRKSIGDQSGNNLRAAVELVDASRASDPRDKIFGVLGLIDSGEQRIAAAYSISFRHLIIGYYAYCLINKRDIRVLIQAPSLRHSEDMPTWMPPAQLEDSESVHIISRLGDMQPNWLYRSKDFTEVYSRHHKCQHQEKGGFKMVAYSLGLDNHTCLKIACEWSGYNWPSRSTFPPSSRWYSNATIESLTGAINLTAMHIMSLGSIEVSKARVERNGEVHIHTLKAGTSTLYIYTDECILDPAYEPDKVHLSVLCDSRGEDFDTDDYEYEPMSRWRICVLRQINDEAKFQLISASVIVCFHAARKVEHLFNLFYHYDMDYDYLDPEPFRFSLNMFVAYDNRLGLSLPLMRVDGPAGLNFYKTRLEGLGLADKHGSADGYPQDWRMPSLAVQDLRKSLSIEMQWTLQNWAEFDSDPGYRDCFLGFQSERMYSRRVSPQLAFPAVNDNTAFLEIFQSILDAERGGSPAKFFNNYFETVREFEPKTIKWKNRQIDASNDASREQVSVIDLVQLKFKPDQYGVLEEILDLIRTEAEEAWLDRDAPRMEGPHGHFNPPFLRIGWRDLALNQFDDPIGSSSLDDEDVHGFYLLDVIRETMYERGDYLNGLSSIKKMPLYDDSVVREHRGETIWVAFDLLSLTLWAQTHYIMTDLRRLSQFCKDGENEMARFLRFLAGEGRETTYPDWPLDIMEDFKIDGELRSITII
ncbi:heterokaryon incompatibility protein het-6-like protein [Colletotrichum asianum]|uniref:Heterokaryon incompatibility protein het-6-like protein n=1 Tax=Colletotrichum asianum TaxID=702518 RepID=A0A8H3WD22_9PEZI|nr:heterokaryon incompatibility protein het-6-like protein [Colletotrichum asianum]